ncbi:MAG: hypothetical protein ABWY27_18265 [Telluria sp.]
MRSEMPRLSPDINDIVFVKTTKGRAEVAQRSAGLTGKHRSILIILDGQKSLRAIGTLLPDDEMAGIVAVLLELALIAPRTEAVVFQPAPRIGAVGRIATSDGAGQVDAEKLSRTKAMMTDTAETYLGMMASEVVRRIQQAGDETQLLSVVGHWHMAMRESKYGRDVAGIHLEQIKASLRR